MRIYHAIGAVALVLIVLTGCVTQQPSAPAAAACPQLPSCPPCPVCPGEKPILPPAKPLQPARWNELPGWPGDDVAAALAAVLESCKPLQKQEIWRSVCGEAGNLPKGNVAALKAFLESRFVPHRVVNPDGTTEGLITGYYEPLLKGSRDRDSNYPYAIYKTPDDLLTIEFGDLYPDLKNYRLRGRIDGRKVVPYYSRAELSRRETELAANAFLWVADPIELFFLQIQGSGRVEFSDGSQVRVGYAEQNGHPYRSIGRWLADQGELKPEQASMDGIKAWARANPGRLTELLNTNPSYVFFRELPAGSGGGPLGAQGVPLTQGRSLAVDPRVIPLGTPVFLSTTWPNSTQSLQRLMVAQDTGGAIRGAVRADFFWGFGADAGAQAGKMRQRGQMWALLPNGHAPK